ncbi:MAG TPA: hypothetical protein ENK82_07640 [Campylobacterales bacterium]|nr:hypothetical protein [Campylobacterales bacterium]
MFNVQVALECGCFRKSEYSKEKEFEKRDDAILYSKAIAELMNEEFCKKHIFSAHEVDRGQFVIAGNDRPGGGGGCCGGGHCG